MFKLIILFYDSDVGCLLHLRQNTNLRHLHISRLWLETAGTTLLGILSQIACFDLETIRLELAGSNPANIEMVEWHQVAQIFTLSQFVKLQNLRLNVVCHSGGDRHACSCTGWWNYISQRMSGLGHVLDLSVSHYMKKS